LLEFVFQEPSPINAAVSLLKSMESTRILIRSFRRAFEEEPAQPFEDFAFLGSSLSPLFLSDIIEGCMNGLHDVEAIQNQGDIGAMLLDSSHVGFTHVTGSPENLLSLVLGEAVLEEEVDRFPALASLDPDDARSVQVIDNGGVLVPLAIGDLIHPDGAKSSDPMPIPEPDNALVEEVGQGRGGNAKEPGSGLLGHQLTVDKQGIFKAVGNTGIGICPGDVFLDTSVGGAVDLLGLVTEKHGPPANRDVSPHSGGGTDVHDTPPAPAMGTAASDLVGFHEEMQFLIPIFELEIAHKDAFQMEQSYDKLPYEGHGFLPFLGLSGPGNRDGVYDLQTLDRKLHFAARLQGQLILHSCP